MAEFSLKEVMNFVHGEELMNELDKLEQERREMFFEALGIPDDGRLNPVMTRKEFREFTNEAEGGTHKVVSNWKEEDTKDKKMVSIYGDFGAYVNYDYAYCFDDGLVYESSLYVGD